jgi:hypothetical protein
MDTGGFRQKASQSSSRRSGWKKFKFQNFRGHAPRKFFFSASVLCERSECGEQAAIPLEKIEDFRETQLNL